MKMLLLVAAAALLATSVLTLPICPPNIVQSVNHIIDLHKTMNKTVFQMFVEDVEDLAEQGCQNNFFCKVQNILHDFRSKNKMEGKQEGETVDQIVTNLDIYTKCVEINCVVILKDVPKSGVSSTLYGLLTYLKDCIQLRNSFSERATTTAPTVGTVQSFPSVDN